MDEKVDILKSIPHTLNGMSVDEALNNLWMEIGEPISVDDHILYDVRSVKFKNPLLEPEWNNYQSLPANIVGFCRDPAYLHFVCKYVLNIDLFPYQTVILSLMWHKPLLLMIASRGAAKSFLLTVYIVLRCLLDQGIRIVVVGSALRQSMVLFNYLEKIWDEAPILQDIVGMKSRPKKDLHQGYWQCGESIVKFLPMGTGDKIRGQRAGIILSDEFSCVSKNTLIQTDEGLMYIKDYMNTDAYDLINQNGELETPDKFIKTPKTDVYKITTQNGYSFKCSEIHKVKTINGWKLAKDLDKEDFLEIDTNDYFPTRYLEKENMVLDEKLGWLMGLLVSEGTVTNHNYINITNTNKDLIDKIQNDINLDWKLYYREPYIHSQHGWNCRESWDLRCHDTKLRYALKEMGLDYVDSGLKIIPKDILMSPRSVVLSFLSGLYEGDGTAFFYMQDNIKRVGVAYYSKSHELVRQLQILLLKFGVISSLNIKGSKISDSPNYMLSCRGANAKKLIDLLDVVKWKELVNDVDYFEYKPYIRKNGDRYIVSTYRANKSNHLGTYDTEEECHKAFKAYWKDTRPCMKVKSVELLDEQEHLYDFHLPKTHSFIGNGFVQHNSINSEIFEVVVRGFAAVRAQGMQENVANAYKEILIGNLEITLDEDSMGASMMKDNQIIMAGTAYYKFNHFYKYYQYYKAIITSGGDPQILKRDFSEMPIPKDLDASKYAIIRLPYEKLPLGMMDKTILSQGKATMDPQIYGMEYGACLDGDTEIITKEDIKQIKDVKLDDLVLTHKNRWQRVTKVTNRYIDEDIIQFTIDGYDKTLRFTKNHPFWQGNESFVPISKFEKGFKLLKSEYHTPTFFTINSIESVHYKGLVYNLEVENDHSYSLPVATVHNCFPNDSEGFYLASWINNATCPVQSDKHGKINFGPRLKGDPQKSYIMGIDPASEDDNFAINIIEKNTGYNAVVYQWTTTRKRFEELKRMNQLQDNIKDYNTYIIKHIRHLLNRFNTELIVIDNGGGGISVKEGLRDPDKCLSPDEPMYYDMEDENCKGLQGRHIIIGIDFQKTEWRKKAHYGLREDILSKTTIFPQYDGSIIEVSSVEDEENGKVFDTLEDCYLEIEQCKQETTLIQHTQTDGGTEKWGVPRVVGMDAEQVKKVLKRDRFTSLLLSNWGCRYLKEEGSYPQSPTEEPFGGVAKAWKPTPTSGGRFVGKGANKMKNLPTFELGGTDYTESATGRRVFY